MANDRNIITEIQQLLEKMPEIGERVYLYGTKRADTNAEKLPEITHTDESIRIFDKTAVLYAMDYVVTVWASTQEQSRRIAQSVRENMRKYQSDVVMGINFDNMTVFFDDDERMYGAVCSFVVVYR